MKPGFQKYFIVFLILGTQSLFAQQSGLEVTLFANATMPYGEFSKNIGDDPRITRRFGFDYGKKVGLADNGIGAGAETSQQVIIPNLNWIISARFLANEVDNSKVASEFQNQMPDSVDVQFENGLWLNFPIFTGFSYSVGLKQNIRMYGILQGGLNITRQPYRKVLIAGDVVEETTFRTTPDFGFEAGFGFKINSRFNIGVRYLNLSNPRYEGTRKLNESFFTTIPKREMNVDGDERPISMIMLFLGYAL